MKPTQFIKYQQALHLSDFQLGFILGMRIEESKTTIPAIKSGEIEIQDWVQPELMKWLALYQREFQRLLALHEQDVPYVCLPKNAVKNKKFYEDIIFHRPDLLPYEEIGEWPTRLTMDQIREHLQMLQGAITLIEFKADEDIEACLDLDTYALYENWRGGYNNFVHFAAGELRQKRVPYLRIDYLGCEVLASLMKEVSRSVQQSYEDDDGEVIPLFPGCAAFNPSEEVRAEYGDCELDESYRESLKQDKAEAAQLAPAFEGLIRC